MDRQTLKQCLVCSITPEVERLTFFGRAWVHYEARCRCKVIATSESWKVMAISTTSSDTLTTLMIMQSEKKETDRVTAIARPAFWKLVERLEADGWRPIYNSDGFIESMVKGDFQVVDGKIIPIDAGFSLDDKVEPTETEVPKGEKPEDEEREKRREEETAYALAHGTLFHF